MLVLDPLQEHLPPRPFGARPASPHPTQHMVPIGELLTPGFVSRHSQFHDVDSLLLASGLDPCMLADLDPGARQHWDDFTRLSTTFPDWAAMVREARGEWIMRRFGICIDA